jgi:hypothetical protein
MRKKTLLKCYLSILVLFLMSSCNKYSNTETIDLNPENVFENSIGILNDKGNFQRLDRIDVNNVIKSDLGLSFDNKNIEFQDFIIKHDENEQKQYFLTTRSTDGNASVSIKLVEDSNGNLLLTADTCKCESSDCSGPSCNASGSGSTCSCSSCFATCKKTSTSGIYEEITP